MRRERADFHSGSMRTRMTSMTLVRLQLSRYAFSIGFPGRMKFNRTACSYAAVGASLLRDGD
jgi:hypothetical protein